MIISEYYVKTKEEFDLLYTTGPLLGKGGFGTVVAGVRNSDQVSSWIRDLSNKHEQVF